MLRSDSTMSGVHCASSVRSSGSLSTRSKLHSSPASSIWSHNSSASSAESSTSRMRNGPNGVPLLGMAAYSSSGAWLMTAQKVPSVLTALKNWSTSTGLTT